MCMPCLTVFYLKKVAEKHEVPVAFSAPQKLKSLCTKVNSGGLAEKAATTKGLAVLGTSTSSWHLLKELCITVSSILGRLEGA